MKHGNGADRFERLIIPLNLWRRILKMPAGKLILSLTRILFICMIIFAKTGCLQVGPGIQDSSGKINIEISNSLSREELDQYADSFETWRFDLWENSAMTWEDKQTDYLDLANIEIKSGLLRITTKADAFSKNGLVGRFELEGDFDVQVDCRFNFKPGINKMDQLVILIVYDADAPADTMNTAHIILYQGYGSKTSFITTTMLLKGTRVNGPNKKILNFDGALRLIRTGNRITPLYRNFGDRRWRQLGEFSFISKKLKIGFGLSNFFSFRTSTPVGGSLSVLFDNFRINAAQKIIESEI